LKVSGTEYIARLLSLVTPWMCLGANACAQAPTVAVAMAQLRSSDVGDFNKMSLLATEAKRQGADLIIFPEESVFGWLNPKAFTDSAPIPGRDSDRFVSIAKKAGIWVAAGLAERGPKAGPGSMPDAYQAYDSGILIDPHGRIVIHHRQFNVVANAFDPAACKSILNEDKCQYATGSLSDIRTVRTPFGKTALLVCADAYTYPPATALNTLKAQHADFVIVPWGVTASQQSECGTSGFDATGYAAEAAKLLDGPIVVGANAVGPRKFGRFLPSVYCGDSGYADTSGHQTEPNPPDAELQIVRLPLPSASR
jgi:predicted amidohydrolase